MRQRWAPTLTCLKDVGLSIWDLPTASFLDSALPVQESRNLTRTLVGWMTPLHGPRQVTSSLKIVRQRQVVVACAAVLANLSIPEVMPLQMFQTWLDRLKLRLMKPTWHSQLNIIEGLWIVLVKPTQPKLMTQQQLLDAHLSTWRDWLCSCARSTTDVWVYIWMEAVKKRASCLISGRIMSQRHTRITKNRCKRSKGRKMLLNDISRCWNYRKEIHTPTIDSWLRKKPRKREDKSKLRENKRLLLGNPLRANIRR